MCILYNVSLNCMAICIIIIKKFKTFPIKMKEDVGMSKHKKDVNKVRWDPKLNKPLPYNPT